MNRPIIAIAVMLCLVTITSAQKPRTLDQEYRDVAGRLRTTGVHYFDWHHTNADTLDKVNPQDLRKCIATLAVMAYVLADMPGQLAP